MGMQAIEAQSYVPDTRPVNQLTEAEVLAAGNAGTPTGVAGVSLSSGSRTASSTSYNTWNPLVYDAAINSVTDMTKAGGSIDQAFTDMTAAITARKAAETQQVTAIQQNAEDIGAAGAAHAAVVGAQAARRNNILSVANINPDQVDNQFRMAVENINRTSALAEPLGKEIDRRMAVGIFDNPLEWLVNQVRLPGMVGEYNAIAGEQNRAITTAKNLQALASSQLAISDNMDADAIAKDILADSAVRASAAVAKLREVQATTAGAGVRDAANTLAMQTNKADLNLRVLALTKERTTESSAESDRKDKAAAEQAQIDDVNRYLKMIGSNRQYTAPTFKLLGTKEKTQLLELSGTGIIAKQFSTAMNVIDGMGSANNIANEGDSAAMNWFKGTIAEANSLSQKNLEMAKAAALGTGKVLDERGHLMQTLDNMQTVYQNQAATDLRTASDNNPVKLNYTFLAKQPLFKGNAVAEYINEFGPAGKTPAFTKVDEVNILDKLSNQGMLNPALIPSLAKQVTDFYRQGSIVQAESTKYPLFGIDKPAGYNVILPSTNASFFSSKVAEGTAGKPIDLTNQAAVELYLTKNIARKINATPSLLNIMTTIPNLGP